MKRISLAIVFACCMIGLYAQESIKVSYQGAKPGISDFAWAFLSAYEYDEDADDCLDEARNAAKQAWIKYRKGLPQYEGVTLTVDKKNGFVLYEYKSEYEGVEDVVKIEMCYWNEADGKHKLFAYNVACFRNGIYSAGQFDGLLFYRYNNSTKTMSYIAAPGFEEQYVTENGAWVSYALPQTGKDISVTYWYENGRKQNKTLKWSGHRFSY